MSKFTKGELKPTSVIVLEAQVVIQEALIVRKRQELANIAGDDWVANRSRLHLSKNIEMIEAKVKTLKKDIQLKMDKAKHDPKLQALRAQFEAACSGESE